MGEACKLKRGKRLTKKLLSADKKYPVFHGGLEPLGFYEKFNREADSVMIINVGASAGTIGYSDVQFWSSDGCFTITKAENLNAKFLYYLLLNNEREFKSKVRKAGIPTLDNKIIENFKIPIPPLEIQKEIVEILDKFDTLTNDLQHGLPAEIKARKAQYEHYREKLLHFQVRES